MRTGGTTMTPGGTGTFATLAGDRATHDGVQATADVGTTATGPEAGQATIGASAGNIPSKIEFEAGGKSPAFLFAARSLDLPPPSPLHQKIPPFSSVRNRSKLIISDTNSAELIKIRTEWNS